MDKREHAIIERLGGELVRGIRALDHLVEVVRYVETTCALENESVPDLVKAARLFIDHAMRDLDNNPESS